MSTPLNTIFSWFETGDFPTQEQFQATFSSFYHKDNSIPLGKVEGLAEMFQGLASSEALNLHFNDADAHANVLAKRDAENITAEHALRWKDKLGITYMATIDSDPEAADGNVYDKEQITAFFATVNQAYTEWGNMIQEIRQALMSNDLNLDELQEIVDYIKQNREEIEQLRQISIGNTTDDKVSLIGSYDEWGAITLQNQFNDIVYSRIRDIQDVLGPTGRTVYSTAVTGNTTITHNLETMSIICEAYDEVTGYTLPVRVRRVDLNTIDIEFDGDVENLVQVNIKKIY